MITNDTELKTVFDELDKVWEAKEGTPNFETLEMLVSEIVAYEDEHYPIPEPTQEEAARFRAEQER